MNIVVTNFSGNTGKTTVAKYLLEPRVPNAVVIAVETLNVGNEGDTKMRGTQFIEIYELLQSYDGNNYIVDVGASNAEIFFEEMAKFGDISEIVDYFIIPTVPSFKQQKDTLNTITQLLKFGVEEKQIRLVFNNVARMDDLKLFASNMAEVAEAIKGVEIRFPQTAIFTCNVFPMLNSKSKKMSDVLKINARDNRAKIVELREKIAQTKNAKEIEEYNKEIVILTQLNSTVALAKTTEANLNEVYADLDLK